MVIAAPVLPINSQILPGHNQETYRQLQDAVQAIPPHQIWLATCDDLPLQRQLAATLEESLQGETAIASTQLILDVKNPDLVRQIRDWAHQAASTGSPLLQILGIERLTYQGSDAQYQFLRSLHHLLPLWKQLGCSLLVWISRPWLKQIRREVPELCQNVFEFMGEPTPISAIGDEQSYQAAFSPVRRWQFLGKPAPEAPPPPSTEHHTDLATAPRGTAVPAIPGEGELETADTPPQSDTGDTLPVMSDDLWQRLQADLTEFEATGTSPHSPSSSDGATDSGSTTNITIPAAAAAVEEFGEEPIDIEVIPPPQDIPSEVAYRQIQVTDQDDWAIAYELRDRVQAGDHSPATLEAAIQQYEQLQPHRPTTPQRTEVLNDLGSLYWLWAQQARDIESYLQRLLQSSELYEAAISPIHPGTDAGVLNRIHSNSGSVYSLLAGHQDPVLYLGKAVRAFHRALQYAPVEAVPDEYATLQTHLGTAYWSLAQHTQEANHLHRAIAAYQEALRHSHPQQSPQTYAQLQNNLGIALWSLSRHERPVFLLEQAIQAYRTALAYRTLDTDPGGCAATHNNLGTAYWDLGGHCEERSTEQQAAWQQAIAAYDAAILAADRERSGHLSFDLWATHHSVGVVYDQLAIALAPNAVAQEPLLTNATLHYIRALVGWQATEAVTMETAFQALVRNLHLQARYLGIEAQQRSLSQVPAAWLPEIWRQL
ncbi:tetratricopeptide repeat protein [Oscillatoria sp. CS-180]|uniref:tetratricopeptide repeat protein n=1 Tax=Oscillatoria sp. CS-180 TaxID=3021720 RepID=UPI00232F3DEA|nr:tetratricopeptide repeat protein [Oscillatoria sp. CS-180]MDB9529834.1 tetratricopeptide repeat protein [Oscillatoria sp. CS-180]